MYYLLYGVTFTVLVTGTILYLTRGAWLHLLPGPARDMYARLPGGGGGFAEDVEAGLSSSTFDLGANLDAGDARAGLDDAARAEILRIMKRRRLRFDEARRVYMEQRFKANGIGADGRPRDPKFVSFS
ncbi:hypothetical protein F4802DRAFT_87350 [Xylaria palmicola]|nr:hypothetical protein F4802DRAFT_87350 [Xylaria palmicola]